MPQTLIALLALQGCATAALAQSQDASALFPDDAVVLTNPSGLADPPDSQKPLIRIVYECAAMHPDYPGLIFAARNLTSSHEYSQVTGWRWQGGTDFSEPFVFLSGQITRSVAMGDFVGTDGKAPFPDLASGDLGTGGISGPTAGTVSVFLSDVVAGATKTIIPTGVDVNPRIVISEDLDNDGDLDLVYTNFFNNPADTLGVLLNDGTGTFTHTGVLYAGGRDPYGIVSRDFNSDGNADLAVSNYGSGEVSVYLGNGDGSFNPATLYDLRPNQTGPSLLPAGITSADLNNDGHPDLCVTSILGFSASVLLGDSSGDGTFGAPNSTSLPGSPSWVASGDLDLDGNIDMVIALLGNKLSVCFGNGNGTFQTPQFIYSVGSPWYVSLGDVNSDGLLDIITSDIAVEASGNDPDVPSRVTVLFNSGPVPCLADLNGDGYLDSGDINLFAQLFLAGCP